ncbi:MAG: winged helix-turn-helix domain-containing protein [Parachlamydiaceae bacterium]|nr:MAG: winged helix-turn-helix domain-containing protein [Parachlamydiaceae bacterium]
MKEHLSRITYLKVKNIIDYVTKQYNVKYSRSGMNAWLTEHGFVYKRPQKYQGN